MEPVDSSFFVFFFFFFRVVMVLPACFIFTMEGLDELTNESLYFTHTARFID